MSTPDPDPGEPAKPRHPWRWLSALIGLVLVGIVASLTVYLPYYAYTPGAATDTEGVIKIDGARVVSV